MTHDEPSGAVETVFNVEGTGHIKSRRTDVGPNSSGKIQGDSDGTSAGIRTGAALATR